MKNTIKGICWCGAVLLGSLTAGAGVPDAPDFQEFYHNELLSSANRALHALDEKELGGISDQDFQLALKNEKWMVGELTSVCVEVLNKVECKKLLDGEIDQLEADYVDDALEYREMRLLMDLYRSGYSLLK